MGRSRNKKLTRKEKLSRRIVYKYTNLKAPASFTSVTKLKKHHFPDQDAGVLRDALLSIDTYSKHKPIRRQFTRHKTITGSIDQQWQLDLMDMQSLARFNDGFRYVLVAIDVFSRHAWATPIKSKGGRDVTEAFQSITQQERKPYCIQTDKGKEFVNTLEIREHYFLHQ